MEYKIIEDTSKIRFEESVNKYIKSGWIPVGGVAIKTSEYGNVYYCQAMIKQDNNGK